MGPIKILLIVADDDKRLQLQHFLEKQGLLSQSSFVDINQLNDNLFKNEFFKLMIVDLSNLKLSASQFVENMKKINDDFIRSSMPTVIIEYDEKNQSQFSNMADEGRVIYFSTLLNLDNLRLFLQKLMPPSVSLSFLTDLAEISMPNSEIFIHKLVEHFKEVIPDKINEIEKLFQSHSFEDISRIAHYLQSACYNVGANYFAEILKELEIISKKGLAKKNGTYWRAKLENEFQKTMISLNDILKNKSYLKK